MSVELTEFNHPKKLFKVAAVVIASFVGLGTVSAVWDNPFFVRMTPVGAWEVVLLAMLSLLFGVYVGIRRPSCSIKTAGTGGVFGFVGIACPVCNKILLVLFGGEVLLTYFEPIRIYVAAVGTIIVFAAVLREWGMLKKTDSATETRRDKQYFSGMIKRRNSA